MRASDTSASPTGEASPLGRWWPSPSSTRNVFQMRIQVQLNVPRGLEVLEKVKKRITRAWEPKTQQLTYHPDTAKHGLPE